MQALQTVEIRPQSHARPRNVRISAKVRRAVDLMVEGALKRQDAAQQAGLTDHALYCALTQPHVLAYRNDRLRVLRESAACRSIARVDILADTAVSEHVKLGANELLMGIEGISKVTKTENMHVHQHLIPGLTVMRAAHPVDGDDALLIGDQRAKPRIAHEIKRIGTPVPHPEDRNASIAPSSASDSRGPKRASRGVK